MRLYFLLEQNRQSIGLRVGPGHSSQRLSEYHRNEFFVPKTHPSLASNPKRSSQPQTDDHKLLQGGIHLRQIVWFSKEWGLQACNQRTYVINDNILYLQTPAAHG